MTATDPLARAAAGTLLASFTGPDVPDWLRRRAEHGLGGVCLFGSNLPAGDGTPNTAGRRITTELHRLRPSFLVAVDEEGGDVTRLEAHRGSAVPGNAALGVVGDLALTRRLAASLGRVLHDTGIDLALAPVADVNVDPENPVIGVRSFGADPAAVAEQVSAFVMGLQGAGPAACAKHFPGHGATRVDSHLGLPVVDVDPDLLRRRELPPFAAAVAADVAAVMTAHLRVPAFGDEPATVNRALLTGLLRDELAFEGVVVTDALDMWGIGGPPAIPGNVVRALAAGADLCCLGPDATVELVDACVDAVLAAVRDGALTATRLHEAAARVAALAGTVRAPAEQEAAGRDPQAALTAVGDEAAARALRLDGPLPGSLAGAHVIELVRPPNIAAGRVPWGVAAAWNELDPAVTGERLDADDNLVAALRRAAGRPLVVVARDPQRRPDQAALLAALEAGRPDLVLVDMGWPADRPPPADGRPWASPTRITTHGASRACGRAAARLLAGERSPIEEVK